MRDKPKIKRIKDAGRATIPRGSSQTLSWSPEWRGGGWEQRILSEARSGRLLGTTEIGGVIYNVVEIVGAPPLRRRSRYHSEVPSTSAMFWAGLYASPRP